MEIQLTNTEWLTNWRSHFKQGEDWPCAVMNGPRCFGERDRLTVPWHIMRGDYHNVVKKNIHIQTPLYSWQIAEKEIEPKSFWLPDKKRVCHWTITYHPNGKNTHVHTSLCSWKIEKSELNLNSITQLPTSNHLCEIRSDYRVVFTSHRSCPLVPLYN